MEELIQRNRKKEEVDMMSPLTRAYVGDAVYELYIRIHLVNKMQSKPHKLHLEAIQYVKAKSQADLLASLQTELTEEEKEKVESLVNQWIKEDLAVTKTEMSKTEALELGAEAMFIEKYPDTVNVYFIGNVSKEICGGPHVSHTSELGHFKIKKEEASSAGIRRIKAILD